MQDAVNTWLILSYFADVDGMAASHHLDDRLPWLKAKGIDCVLLSSPCGPSHNAVHRVRVPSLAPSGIRYELRYFLRRHLRHRFWFKFGETLVLIPLLPFYLLEKLCLKLDSTWSWFLSAGPLAYWLGWRHKPALIYSTGGPWTAHLAAIMAARRLRVPCLVEFQDPLTHFHPASQGWERNLINKVEAYVFRHATAVLFLTQQAADNARARHPHGAPAYVIYAGANPSEQPGIHRRGDTCTVAHFGSLAGSRDLGSLLAACELLLGASPAYAQVLRIALYGSNDRRVVEQIAAFSHRELVEIKGKIARHDTVRLMAETDVLLLIQNTDATSGDTIPSKVYEYCFTGRPVLALLYRNEELKSMLTATGHQTVEADDVPGIKAALQEYLERWQRDELPTTVTGSYTTARAVEQLVELAAGLAVP